MFEYEMGPIRPPSEARSLLIRVTRGCHWNKCNFCGLYKDCKFSARSLDDILMDIKVASQNPAYTGIASCFLQDADAFILKTDYLLTIVNALKAAFPSLLHVTSYARSDSILRKSQSELQHLSAAGLNHLYCGMESASDDVLKIINKGLTAQQHINAGIRAKEAGMILSEFILFGLGGKEYSEDNAILTANALSQIKPDYIRVHAAAIKPETELSDIFTKGTLTLLTEEEIILEQKLFLETISPINSTYLNEHAVNLLLEVCGNLKTDIEKMLKTINRYLTMSTEDKTIFTLGRRLNIIFTLSDMENEESRLKILEYLSKIKAREDYNFDIICNLLRANMI